MLSYIPRFLREIISTTNVKTRTSASGKMEQMYFLLFFIVSTTKTLDMFYKINKKNTLKGREGDRLARDLRTLG